MRSARARAPEVRRKKNSNVQYVQVAIGRSPSHVSVTMIQHRRRRPLPPTRPAIFVSAEPLRAHDWTKVPLPPLSSGELVSRTPLLHSTHSHYRNLIIHPPRSFAPPPPGFESAIASLPARACATRDSREKPMHSNFDEMSGGE